MLYNGRNSEAIATLHPVFRKKVESLLVDLEKAGIDILIYYGFRTAEEQEALYAKGGVTNARGGWSFHNYGAAIDFVPVSANGQGLWKDYDTMKRVATIAKRYGMEWGGDAGIAMDGDYGHLQYTQGMRIYDFMVGKTLQEETYDIQRFLALRGIAEARGENVFRRFKERAYAHLQPIFNHLFPPS